ncbi:MAG: lamin tail domain-containing protein, partial [Nanoarchaeota archaeon]|nr:lamin tail domain-containing protein [Nanoarchaeota archaeon]
MKKEVIYVLMFVVCSFLVNADVVINEIMYNPQGDDNNKEFIEIYSENFVNLTDYTIQDSSSSDILVPLQFYDNSYSLIVEEDFNYTGINASVYSVGATIGNNLNNDEDVLTLKDFDNNVIDSVSYNDSWGADGNGMSLELINPNFDNNLSTNWSESSYINGTPGEQNSIFEDLDNVAPIINLIYPENNSYLNFDNINFSFSVMDNSESFLNCFLYLNDVLNQTNETVLHDTLTYFSVFNLDEGVYAWNISCNDSSNNMNISETRLVNIDTINPYIFLSITPSVLEFGIENTTVNFTITDTNLDSSVKNLTWPNGTLYKTFTDNLTLTTQNLTILGNYSVYLW